VSWSRRKKALAIAALALVGTCWWLFGITFYKEGPHTMTLHRWFGRVTRVDVVSSAEKVTRLRILYSWSEPYEQGDPIGSCSSTLPEAWQDWNGDGRWDTWTYRVGPDRAGECSVEYRVDLNNDERPDWRFVSRFGDWDRAHEAIKRRRGF
jgi:hypothetical protein